jgi:hypothetical protein
MKRILLVIPVMLVALALNGKQNCECGSHATAIYAYNVSGSDCCDSTAGKTGWKYEYEKERGDVWVLTGTTEISGSTAQDHCCEAV